MFHVPIHNKYSVVNIITCFAGPTTWGHSRDLGQSIDLGTEASDWRGESTFGMPRCLGRPPQKKGFSKLNEDCDLILFRVLLFGFDNIFNQRLGGYNEGMTS